MRLALIGQRAALMDYCRDRGIDHLDRESVVLISSPDAMRGLHGPLDPVFVGPAIRGANEIAQHIAVINAATRPRLDK